jgi:hypothetical protein
MNRFFGLLTLLLCVMLTGCGSAKVEVTGTVRYYGKPLPYGTIQFLGTDGIPYAAPIQPDGTYTLLAPTGPAKVIVSCVDEARLNHFTAMSSGRGGRTVPPPMPATKFSQIPQRYADWNTSGLTAVVEPGGTAQDFALTR